MVQTCKNCSRANPAEAVYCYYDGFVLVGHSHNGGPVAVGAVAFAHPFVFPGGRQCRSFDELAVACQEEWSAARDLLGQGYLENFFGGLGRVDLAMAAKDAAKFPDADLGLSQLLDKLPSQVLAEPKLALETQEINLGVLEVGGERAFHLHMENQGMRLISGAITSADAPWLALGDAAGNQKHFHFQHDLNVPIHVLPDKLRANNKPLTAHLEVESNGGSFIVTVRAQVPVKPFPSGALAGVKSPRQAAEKAKAHSKEAAALFESGVVAEWYKANGWTYPVQGPAASGLGAVQQFFEALGLTAPPKVEISTERIELSGNPGEQLRFALQVKSQEKRPVYAHAVSNQPWLEVGRAQLDGRVATIDLTIPAVPNKDGETLSARLIVQSNGNQRFVVPVTLQVGNSLFFGNTAPAGAEAATVQDLPADVELVPPSSPAEVSSEPRRRRRPAERPPIPWKHLAPAGLLLLVVLGAVVIDSVLPPPTGTAGKDENNNSPAGWTYIVRDPDPRLSVRFDPERERFGVEMTQEKDPDNPERNKRLTFDDRGLTNNTIIKIDGYEYKFGERTPSNVWGSRGRLKQVEITQGGRHAWESTMNFNTQKIEAVQHVEIVPGQTGSLDTVLVYYTLHNRDKNAHKVGIRVMLDTFIGSNDGVPFTIPGKKNFVDTKAEFAQKDIPAYIEAIENPNDSKNPGTVARLCLRHFNLPGVDLEDMNKLLICRFPGNPNAGWDEWAVESMKPDSKADKKEKGDSCVVMYWGYKDLKPKEMRHVAFTYGLGSLEIGGALALSVPSSVQPNSEFVVTAYVWDAAKGDKVKLIVPAGLKLASGESAEKTIEAEGKRSQVFWRLRSGPAGDYLLEATSDKDKSKPKKVTVKPASIFG